MPATAMKANMLILKKWSEKRQKVGSTKPDDL